VNTKQKGNIGLGVAIAYFTNRLLTVSIPINDSQPYDLVVEFEDKSLQKIQVKTTSFVSQYGIPSVGLRSTGGNQSRNYAKYFDKNSCDYIFVYVLNTNNSYLIPSCECNKNTINLGTKFEKFKI